MAARPPPSWSTFPGEVLIGRDDARRLPDGAAGPRRPGAGHRRHRLVLRRLRLDRAGRGARRAAHQRRAAVRSGRVFLADGARPRASRWCWRRARSSRRWPWSCSACCCRWSAPISRPAQSRMAFDIPELADGIGFVMRRHGRVWLRRDHAQPGAGRAARHRAGQDHRPHADAAGPHGVARRDRPRHPAGLHPRHPAGRRRHHRVVRGLHVGEEAGQGSVALRPRRHRGRRGAGKRQQCGRADLVHSAAHARHSAQRRHGADGRRHDDPRHRARARRS